MNKIIIYFSILLFSFSSVAKELPMGSMPSLEWQKRELEKELSTKIDQKLGTVFHGQKYYYNINISTLPLKKPNFKQIEASKVPPVKHSNKKAEAVNNDYIVFNKFALEVPSISLLNSDNVKEHISELEYIWKYNESIDIFNNLDSVEISFYFDEKIPEAKREQIKKMIETINFGLPDIIPSFNYSYSNLNFMATETSKKIDDAKDKKEAEAKAKDMEGFGNYALAFSLILASIILGIFGLMLINKYAQIKKPSSEAQTANSNNDKNNSDKDAATLNQANTETAENEESGFHRFVEYLEKTPNRASLLVKKWIKANDDQSAQALYGLVKMLDNDRLKIIFQNISQTERENWKNILNQPSAITDDLKVVGQFISNEIVDDMIVPNIVEDEELLDQLISLSDEKAASFLKENKDYAPYLINILNTKSVNGIFTYLRPVEIKEVLKASSTVNMDHFKNIVDNFKESLSPFIGTENTKIHLRKIAQLISLSNAFTDMAFYEALKEEKEENLIFEVAKNYYPSQLILNLDQTLLGKIITNYPNVKKTKLIYSLSDDKQKLLTDAISIESMKEMILMEIESIEFNQQLKAEIINSKEDIWNEFVLYSREIIKSDYQNSDNYREVLAYWVSQPSETQEELTLNVA